MYNVGDNVLYPLHGAGTIESIETKEILGETQQYYVINIPGNIKCTIPTNKAETIGIRTIVNAETASDAFKVLENKEMITTANWNKHYRDNMEKMRSGDIYQLTDVVRELTYKQKEKNLSTNEKKMLTSAKQILVSELVLVQNATPEAVEAELQIKLDEGYQNFVNTPSSGEAAEVAGTYKKFIPYSSAN
jgi:CarD family transcriptional regulator